MCSPILLLFLQTILIKSWLSVHLGYGCLRMSLKCQQAVGSQAVNVGEYPAIHRSLATTSLTAYSYYLRFLQTSYNVHRPLERNSQLSEQKEM